MTINIKVEHLDGSSVRKYISDNCKQLRNGFWEVKKELKVWKATTTTTETLQVSGWEGSTHIFRRCIVALRIPVGEKIYVQPMMYRDNIDNRKMRASKAYVEKQFVIGHTCRFFNGDDDTISFELNSYYETTETTSVQDITFLYQTGNFVRPKQPFYNENVVCASGIHFFVNLTDALYYV